VLKGLASGAFVRHIVGSWVMRGAWLLSWGVHDRQGL
jgi:hypothetical protein